MLLCWGVNLFSLSENNMEIHFATLAVLFPVEPAATSVHSTAVISHHCPELEVAPNKNY